jgi:D-alanine-D-alanine ligase
MTNLLILFGGESNEHSISNISAYNILNAINKDKYNIIKIGITCDGKWYIVDCPLEDIKTGSWVNYRKYEAIISPSKTHKGVIVIRNNTYDEIEIDVCFPILHGANGEDGTIAALLKLAGIKCVTADFLSSAMAMDKKISKILFQNANIPVVPAIAIDKSFDYDAILKNISFPVFVKPANSGSSVGCSAVHTEAELMPALENAFVVDDSILIEKYIACREIECAVMGDNDKIFVSAPGEISSSSDFYDFDTKYVNTSSVKLDIPASIDENTKNTIMDYAKKAYIALGLSGLSRVDFFMDKNTNEIYINEINTIPGFTSLSMFPLLMKNEGIEYQDLLDKLIANAN